MKQSTMEYVKEFLRDLFIVLTGTFIVVGFIFVIFLIIWKYNLLENVI